MIDDDDDADADEWHLIEEQAEHLSNGDIRPPKDPEQECGYGCE